MNQTDSEFDPDYPFEEIEYALRFNNKFHVFFGDDIVQEPLQGGNVNLSELAQYSNHSLCNSMQSLEHPKKGKNLNGEEVIVVNQGEKSDFRQGIKVEKCL